MSEQELPYFEYVKEAFNLRPPMKGLGAVPLNWMAILGVGTLGLLNPGFWLIGAGLELAFLVSVSHNERFRAYVRRKRDFEARTQHASGWESRRDGLLATLDEDDQQRFATLISRIDRALQLQGEGAFTGLVAEVAEEGLQKLQWVHLKLLVSRAALHRQMDHSARAEIEAELNENVRRIESLGTQGDPRVRRSLEATSDILRQRLKNHDDAQDNFTYIESELRRIEHQAELIIEEAALSKDPDVLSSRIDAVTETFGETQQWMRLHKELLTDFDDDEGPGRPTGRVTT